QRWESWKEMHGVIESRDDDEEEEELEKHHKEPETQEVTKPDSKES
ncbi:hemolysin, partial [Vibrio diabolicus]